MSKRAREDCTSVQPSHAEYVNACAKRVRPGCDDHIVRALGKHIAASACAAACAREAEAGLKALHEVSVSAVNQSDPWHTARLNMLHQCGVAPADVQAVLEAGGGQQILWRCFTDLNLLCQQYQPDWMSMKLKGYHNICIVERQGLFEQFLRVYESTLANSPGTSALLEFVHDIPLAHLPYATLIVYTVEAPQWLQAWCATYGIPGNNLTIYKIQGYSEPERQQPACTLYVPKLSI